MSHNTHPIGFFPLYEAARNGDLEKLKFLLNGREDEISLYDNAHHYKVSDTIICHAAQYGHVNILKYMVEIGADLSVRNNYALCYAAVFNHIDVVRYIISTNEIDIDNDDYYDDIHTAVWYAAKNGHTDMIKTIHELIDGSRYLKVLGEDIYTTAIYWAGHTDRRETIKYLASVGASTKFLTETQKRYMAFCKKMEEKKRIRAQKKIYFWWIQICYDMSRECGKRMANRNLSSFEELMSQQP